MNQNSKSGSKNTLTKLRIFQLDFFQMLTEIRKPKDVLGYE